MTESVGYAIVENETWPKLVVVKPEEDCSGEGEDGHGHGHVLGRRDQTAITVCEWENSPVSLLFDFVLVRGCLFVGLQWVFRA